MSRRRLPEALTPITAEASVLGGVLLRNDLLAELTDLRLEHFHDLRHRAVYSAMLALHAAGSPIDGTTIEQELARSEKLEAIGGITFIGELALIVPTPDNVHAYAKDVRLAWRNREALLAIERARDSMLAGGHPAAEMLEETVADLARFSERAPAPDTAAPNKWVRGLSELLGESEPDDDDSLDWIIRDVLPRTDPMLFAGPAKAGKTWTAIDMAIAIAMGQPWIGMENCLRRPGRVVVLCREDGERRLRKRLWELCRARNVAPFERGLIDNLIITTATLRMPGPDVARFARELRDWRADVVIVDNLSRVLVGDPNKTRDASDFAHAWYELGELSGAGVCFLHHTKKEQSDSRKETDPFDSIRGSGDFVAAARHIMLAKPVLDEHATTKRSEIRMRGNLDLGRESFALGFERYADARGRMVAEVSHRGDIEDLRVDRKQAAMDRRIAARDLEEKTRRDLAIQIATREGNVSQAKLARALGLSSERSVAGLLNEMVSDGQLVRAGRAGYTLASAQVQLPPHMHQETAQ